MSAWKRIGAWVGAAVVVAVVGAFVTFDRIASAAIERGATHALGVETRVGFARISPVSGSFRMRGLEVENPAGFESGRFLGLGLTRLDLEMATLRQHTVIVPLFRIDDVDLHLDKQAGKANYEVILDNLARFESGDAAAAPEAEGEAAKQFVVEEVVIRDVEARVEYSEAAGRLGEVVVVVPEIRMDHLGAEGAGLTAAELTDLITKALLASIARAGAGLPGGIADSLSSGLGRLRTVEVKMPDGVRLKQAGGAAGELVGDAAEKAGEALGGLRERLTEGDD